MHDKSSKDDVKMGEKAEFKSISLKAALINEIEDFIQKNKKYRSVAEFVSEAARLRLEILEKEA